MAGILRAGGLSLVSPFFVLYLRHVLGLGFAEIGVLSAVVGIVPLVLLPFAGFVTDRLGRRNLFLIALVCEVIAILGAAVAMEYRSLVELMVAVSSAQIVGTIGGPALSAYVADLAEASDRTQGFTWIRTGWNVGFSLGVFAGGP